jgi:hypothetical protein
MTSPAGSKDMDREKGAVESDHPHENTNTSMGGQLGHRDQDSRIKPLDTDFPEPGANPEHSGEPEANLLAREDDYNEEPASAENNPEGALQDNDPGERQKRNQGDQKEDPLAA